MPAKTFFAMLKAGREEQIQKHNAFLADLCDITAVPIYTAEYHKKLREYYLKLAYPDSRMNKGKTLSSIDPETGKLIASLFRQKGKVDGNG
jgi:hypothetical protein